MDSSDSEPRKQLGPNARVHGQLSFFQSFRITLCQSHIDLTSYHPFMYGAINRFYPT
jgi:hypothetical protein